MVGHGGEGSDKLVEVFFFVQEFIGVVSRIVGIGCCDGEAVHHAICSLAWGCDAGVAFVISVQSPVVTNFVAQPDS